MNEKELKAIALQTRKYITRMFRVSGQGHFGGSFSCVEIVTELYFEQMRVNAENPAWPDRDRFIISKGHGAPAVYGTLIQKGFIPEAWVEQYEKLGASLSTHPNYLKIPGFDMSAGSLGHGLAVGAGMALAAKMDGKDYRTYVLLGDGEENEGAVWEAALCANKYKLDNLTAITDRNRLCVGGCTEDVMPMEPLRDKWESFGFEVSEADGHDFVSLNKAFTESAARKNGKPKMVICNTVKAKGIAFAENDVHWHAHTVDDALYERIMAGLEAQS